MNPKRPKQALPFWATLCAILLAGVADAAEPQVAEGFVNAPVGEVWRLFTAPTSGAQDGQPRGQHDLRIGGEIRAPYAPENAAEADTAVSEILAYEPERMLALRMKQPPADFPSRAVPDDLWTIVYLTASGEDMTHVRIVQLGYSDEPASRAAREFLAGGHRRMLDTIAKQYWPQCARCAAEQDQNLE